MQHTVRIQQYWQVVSDTFLDQQERPKKWENIEKETSLISCLIWPEMFFVGLIEQKAFRATVLCPQRMQLGQRKRS